MGKLRCDRWVWAPHRCSAGTSTCPRASSSMRHSLSVRLLAVMAPPEVSSDMRDRPPDSHSFPLGYNRSYRGLNQAPWHREVNMSSRRLFGLALLARAIAAGPEAFSQRPAPGSAEFDELVRLIKPLSGESKWAA